MKTLGKNIMLAGILALAVLLTAGTMAAAEKEDKVKDEETKEALASKEGESEGASGSAVEWSQTGEITGEIGYLDDKYISIIYAHDDEARAEYEVLLPIEDGGVTVDRKKSLKELSMGDTVTVGYEQGVENVRGKQKMRRKARSVQFIKSAPPVPPDPEWGED